MSTFRKLVCTMDLSTTDPAFHRRNKLKQIPKAVLLLPRLANLDISHNCLTSVDFSGPLRCTHRSDEGNTFLAAFPSTPTRQPLPEDPNEILPAVKSFNLANNQIKSTTLPAAWPRAMQTLDLGSNAISGTMNFAPLAQLAKLERLNLEGNGIAKGSAPESGGFPALTYLNMKANEIKQIEWIKSIVSTRPIQYRGADEWVAGATATVQEGALEVVSTAASSRDLADRVARRSSPKIRWLRKLWYPSSRCRLIRWRTSRPTTMTILSSSSRSAGACLRTQAMTKRIRTTLRKKQQVSVEQGRRSPRETLGTV